MSTATPYEEKELLLRISRGEEAAFQQLFNTYHATLYTYLNKILSSREAAEEITADVFLKLWTGRERLTAIIHFEAFLFRIARNMAIDGLRAMAKQRIVRSIDREDEVAGGENADAGLLYAQAQQVLAEAVAQLSPQRRMVYQLSREQGYAYEEIAAQMGLSVHSVRNYLAAAQAQVREHVAGRLPIILLNLLCL